MKTTKSKKILIVVTVLLFCWLTVFITDFIRAGQLKIPVFAWCISQADDGGSGSYIGLCYKIEVKKYIDADYGIRTQSVEMYLFGNLITSSIE